MGTVGHGHKTYVGVGEESTWGTSVARSAFFEVNSASLEPTHTLLESASLLSPGIVDDRVKAGSLAFAGDISTELHYAGQELLLKHAMGSVATAATGNGGYTHTFSISDALPTGLTVEVFKDSSNFTTNELNQALLYEGGKISRMELSASVDSFLMATFGFVAEDENRDAKSSPTYTSTSLIPFTQGAVTFGHPPNGASIKVTDFTLSLDNALEMSKRRIGSRLIFQPTRSDSKLSVTGSFRMDFDSFAQYDHLRAADVLTLDLTFTGGGFAAGDAYTMAINVPKLMITGHSSPVDGAGEVEQTVTWRAYRDTATDSEFTIALTNDTVSV